MAGVNGIKTGYTRASGFNLVHSVIRGKRQIVGVVMGGETGRQRDQRMAGLIADYIPKASTGTRIASVPDADTAVAAIARRTCRCRCRVRPSTTAAPPRFPRRRAAARRGRRPSPLRSADNRAICTAGSHASRSARRGPTAIASLVGANSVFAPGRGRPGPTPRPKTISSDAASPGAVITGWKIQIAATPTQSSAEDILDQALAKGAAVLAKASPYTEPVVSGNTTLYRARFAGFANKNEARAACAYLTRRDFHCLAMSD